MINFGHMFLVLVSAMSSLSLASTVSGRLTLESNTLGNEFKFVCEPPSQLKYYVTVDTTSQNMVVDVPGSFMVVGQAVKSVDYKTNKIGFSLSQSRIPSPYQFDLVIDGNDPSKADFYLVRNANTLICKSN